MTLRAPATRSDTGQNANIRGVTAHRLILAALATIGAASCSNTERPDAALSVTVKIGPRVKANCVRLWAQADGGKELATAAAPREDKDRLVFAVFRRNGLDGELTLGARGYLGESCDVEAGLSLNEETAPLKATFPEAGIKSIELALDGVPAQFDLDEDGYRAEAHGGVDCHDTNAQVHPGQQQEVACADGLDNDCNKAMDCVDPACAGKLCTDGNACTQEERCSQGACGAGLPVTCDDSPPGECFSAPGACSTTTGQCTFQVNVGAPCEGGHCDSTGGCVKPSVEVDCSNGLDDNGNDLADCDDPDCLKQACNDKDACTDGEVCGAGVCVDGKRRLCELPPDPCHEPVGMCQPDGLCTYTQKAPGSSCGQGLSCAKDGTCVTEESGKTCFNGVDDDGDGARDCEDPGCNGASCDDQNACTVDETCSAATSTCGGGMPTPDLACPGGFCSATGVCEAPFPYPPSNFDPFAFPPAQRSGPVVLDCNVSTQIHPTFDSSPNAPTPFTNWCPNAAIPVPVVISQPNGPDVVVLPMKGLTITANSALRLTGSRPVILAVYGDATIRGALFGGGYSTSDGPGGNLPVCNNAGAGGPGQTGRFGGGGGGGGFATAGGDGGAGQDNNTAGGSAGATWGKPGLVPLQGGCRGGAGGAGAGGGSGGAGGGAGGAFQLSASGILMISGYVAAPGGGGRGAVDPNGQAGGGGGGSGGAILLEGNHIALASTALITATGGGGGEGRGPNETLAGDGNPGEDGRAYATGEAQGGQDGSMRGGNGGDGANGGNAGKNGQKGQSQLSEGGGGGGGGGGSGRIRINKGLGSCTLSGARIFPSATGGAANCP